MADIPMPKMGDGMEEGTITAWLKQEGDSVKSGDAIAEVETDKANVEIAAYETGILTKILVQVGETVPVGASIGIIGNGSAAANGNGAKPSTEAKAAPVEPKAAPAPEKQQSVPTAPTVTPEPAAETEREHVRASPLARA